MPSIPNITGTVWYNGTTATYDNWANTGLTFQPGQSYVVAADKASLLLASGKFSTSAASVQESSRVIRLYTLPKVVEVGDSFTERNAVQVSSGWFTTDLGITNMMQTFLKYRMNVVYSDGVSGSGALAPISGRVYRDRLQAALAYNPDWVILRASTNDIPTTSTVDDLIEEYSALFSTINAAGAMVVTNTIGPMTSANAAVAAYKDKWVRFNSWLQGTAPRLFNLVCLEQHYQYADPDVSTGAVESPGTDVHPTSGAVLRIAYQSALQLSPFLTNQTIFDAWGAVNAVGDFSRDANPNNVGTGGILGTGVTGSVSTNWRVTTQDAGGTGSAVASKVRRYDGPGYWQQAVWTSSAANEQLRYQYVGSSIALDSEVAVGDIVCFFMEVEFDSAATASTITHPLSFLTYAGTAFTSRGQTTSMTGTWGGVAPYRCVVMTPAVPIPTGTTSLGPYCFFTSKAAETVTVRFGRHGFINWSRNAGTVGLLT